MPGGSAHECVAMKPIMIMPMMLLQKTHCHSKTCDNVAHLTHQQDLWKQDDIGTGMYFGAGGKDVAEII